MKKRKRITEIIVKQSAEICSITTNEDGTYSLIDAYGNHVEHEQIDSVGYLRDSGKPKILRSIVRSGEDNFGENPWKKYEKIGFIDTNRLMSDSHNLYVSSSSLLLWNDDKRRYANVLHLDLLIGCCTNKVNPERIGWRDFIRRIQESELFCKDDKILVIVDSEKGLIPLINERKEPVVDGFMLPQGFTIAYATSDSGSESWINKEMKRRDKVSARAIIKIKKDKAILDQITKSSSLYINNIFE
ncbi:MAG: hypothetical protein JW746_07585 [Candidatus Krumholzibacteriota bacterium]|nr:hypothetical protein [Candidatus Krumholzibacteriota bacterium]